MAGVATDAETLPTAVVPSLDEGSGPPPKPGVAAGKPCDNRATSMNDLSSPYFQFGDFRLDARKRVLRRLGGEQIALTPKLFDTLLYLVEHAGVILEKDELMAALWPGLIVEENNLTQAISSLRRALADDGEDHRYIVTVPRRGYRFVAEVEALNEPPNDVAAEMTTAAAAVAVPTPPTEGLRAPVPVPAQTAIARIGIRSRRAAIIVAALSLAVIVGAAFWRSRGQPVAPVAKSIAVLPFSSPGGSKDDEFFGEGITDDMVTQLSQIADLKVISRNSTLRYRGTGKSLREVARELGVAYLLVGSVRRGEQRFRINAQLVDAERDENLWARTYDRDNRDILAVQSEVTTEIANSLKATLLDSEKGVLEKRARGNAEAYVLYLKGMYELRPRIVNELDGYEGAPAYFQKVIAIDPESPLGYAGMAYYHIGRARLGAAPAVESNAIARQLLNKALELDGNSVDVHIALAELLGISLWDWPAAEKAARRAIDLNPGNGRAWDIYRKAFLEPTGRLDEALAAQQRAVALDPFNSAYAWRHAVLYQRKRDCDEAIRLARASLAMDPAFRVLHTVIVSCLETQGKFQEAIAENRLVKGYWLSDQYLDEQEKILAKEGEKGYRRAKYRQQLKVAQTRNDSWYFAASAALLAGEKDAAFRYLDLAIKAVDRNVIYVKIDSDFDAVRSDPRYLDALKRLRLD